MIEPGVSVRLNGEEEGHTSLLEYSTKAYPRGFPLSGPDLWKRKSSFAIFPYFEKTWSRVYLDRR